VLVLALPKEYRNAPSTVGVAPATAQPAIPVDDAVYSPETDTEHEKLKRNNGRQGSQCQPGRIFFVREGIGDRRSMAKHKQNRSRAQKALRRRRNERAFLFDNDLTRRLGDVDRDEWEFAISISGGDVAAAGLECGISDLPRGAKALWGRSAEEALETYRRWKKKRRE
jgi:hypothetical protein